MSRSNARTPRADGSTSLVPSQRPRTSSSRPGSPRSPRTVTSRSTGVPWPDLRTSARASSRTRPRAPAASRSIGNGSRRSPGVATVPRRGSHRSQWTRLRMPAGWTVRAAPPVDVEEPYRRAGAPRDRPGGEDLEADVVRRGAVGPLLGDVSRRSRAQGGDRHGDQSAAEPPDDATGRPTHEHQAVPSPRPHVGSHGLERALRARDPLDPGVAGHGRAQRPGERLELRLDDVVRVAAGEHPHVQGDLRRGTRTTRARAGSASRRTCPPMTTYSWPARLARVHDVRAAGDVDDGLHERLVERDGRVAEPRDAALVAEGLADAPAPARWRRPRRCGGRRRACRPRLDGEVDERVLRERRRACGRRTRTPVLTSARPVPSRSTVDLHGALGRAPAHRGGARAWAAHGGAPARWVGTRSETASRNRVVSWGVPAVTRR